MCQSRVCTGLLCHFFVGPRAERKQLLARPVHPIVETGCSKRFGFSFRFTGTFAAYAPVRTLHSTEHSISDA
ncbi:hypothetical protein J6590_024054 [Homalodisca vitripennis]|nr:hypothetical protein J6590_024054 [Homalodisca vitripennis]